MKNLLFVSVFCFGTSIANAQSATDAQATLQDSHHAIIGYVKSDGSVYNTKNEVVCQFKSNLILDGHSKPLGYITAEGAVLDAKQATIGFINGASFEDNNHKPIGSVTAEGAVKKSDNTIIGYEVGTEPMWAGLYFFMFKS